MKHYYLSLFLAILLSMACTMTSAHDIAAMNSDGRTIYYNINSDGSTLTVTYRGTSYDQYSNNYSGEIVIPETVTYRGKNYRVTDVSDNAFRDCSVLTSLTIPNSVTTIGDKAFSYCTALTSLDNSDNVISVGTDAFENTPWLYKQPDGVLYVGKVAYKYKGTMPDNTSITLKEGIVAITPHAFYNCSGLTSVTIPNSVTSIGEGAFYGCLGLTSVTIPNSVTSIGTSAFYGCSGLTSVTIPNSMTSIGSGAFSWCI